jgi:hypothetical protein
MRPNPTTAAKHVALLGDSTFDNSSYVAGDPDVLHQLRKHLPLDWQVSLLAVDGSVIADVDQQSRELPSDTTHLVVSIGGNDALQRSAFLVERVDSLAEALVHLSAVREIFEQGYRSMLHALLDHALPTVVCTIYEPRFPDPAYRRWPQLASHY